LVVLRFEDEAFDAINWGTWMSEEVVKGFVFEAQNPNEERNLIKFVSGIGEIKKVELEVAC
jgi:hypothetical protein